MINSILKIIIFVLLAGFLGFGLYKLDIQNKELQKDLNSLSSELKDIEDENKKLNDQINFFNEPENLLKELKSQFNYHNEGEEMIIIIPKTATSSVEKF
jgi:cell division protein FtsB